MADQPSTGGGLQDSTGRKDLSQKYDAISWATFLIWVGVATLADVGWSVGLLGVSAILLGGALIRRYVGLKVEGFWVVVGLLFLAWGLWDLFNLTWPLAPFVIIACGIAMLLGAIMGKYPTKK